MTGLASRKELILLAAGMFYAIFPPLSAATPAVSAVSPAANDTSSWHYKTMTDEMRGGVSQGAFVESSNSVSPGGYYNSDTRLHLALRKKGKKTDAYVDVVPRGQLGANTTHVRSR